MIVRRRPIRAAISDMTIATLAAMGFLLLAPQSASTHENDRGMDYRSYKNQGRVPCCNNEDCRPAQEFNERIDGDRIVFRLLVDGVWIDVPRTYVVAEDAPDGRAHWCGVKMFVGQHGAWLPATRCLILPPRGM